MIKLEILHLPVRVREKDTRKSAQSHMSLRRNNKVSIMEETKPHASVSLPRVEENTFCVLHNVLYSGKLLRKKTFTNFRSLWLFLWNLEGWNLYGPISRNSWKNVFHQFTKIFSLESFPLYSTLLHEVLKALSGITWCLIPRLSSKGDLERGSR